MQDAATIIPVVNEVRNVTWLIGGGMSLLILKEVFSFIKAWKKNGNNGNPKDSINTTVAHALQSACLGRLESASLAQTAALIEITSDLRRIRQDGK